MTKWTIENTDVMKWAKNYSGEKFHALFCDPPYELKFMSKGWDGTGIAFNPEMWAALGEYLYDGAFGMAFAGTRGYHRMACAIEDAGFIIHPVLTWINGQGFPKATRVKDSEDFEGHRYGLQALKPSVEMICVFQKPFNGRPINNITTTGAGALWIDGTRLATNSAIDDPRLGGNGDWSTVSAAKNVYEGGYAGDRVQSSVLGRWPANVVLQHTPECRKVGQTKTAGKQGGYTYSDKTYHVDGFVKECKPNAPSNYGGEQVAKWECVEGCPVLEMDRQSGNLKSGFMKADTQRSNGGGYHGGFPEDRVGERDTYGDSGGASRFFLNSDWSYEISERLDETAPFMYCPKASRSERDAGLDSMPLKNVSFMNTHNGNPEEGEAWNPIDDRTGKERNRFQAQVRNPHPTVKPISLNKWLATLLLPPDRYSPRRILNPFSGVASEAIGAMLTGWDEIVMIEQDAEYCYCDIAQARMEYWCPKVIIEDKDVPRQISMF